MEEEAEFDRAEVSPADEALLQPGAIFYWHIGYRDRGLGGQRTRESVIRFRRLPALMPEERTAAKSWAQRVHAMFDDG